MKDATLGWGSRSWCWEDMANGRVNPAHPENVCLSDWLIRTFRTRLKPIRGRKNAGCRRKHVYMSTASSSKRPANYLTRLWTTVMLSALVQRQQTKWLLQHPQRVWLLRFQDGNLRVFQQMGLPRSAGSGRNPDPSPILLQRTILFVSFCGLWGVRQGLP